VPGFRVFSYLAVVLVFEVFEYNQILLFFFFFLLTYILGPFNMYLHFVITVEVLITCIGTLYSLLETGAKTS